MDTCIRLLPLYALSMARLLASGREGSIHLVCQETPLTLFGDRLLQRTQCARKLCGDTNNVPALALRCCDQSRRSCDSLSSHVNRAVQALNVFERHLLTKPHRARIRPKQTRTPECKPVIRATHDNAPESLKSVSKYRISQRDLSAGRPRAS